MPATVMLSIVLVGAGAVAAAAVGLLLPEGERLSAVLPLVLGAGIGVAALAVGVFVKGTGGAGVVLVASVAGFLGVIAGLIVAVGDLGLGHAATDPVPLEDGREHRRRTSVTPTSAPPFLTNYLAKVSDYHYTETRPGIDPSDLRAPGMPSPG